MSDISQWDPVDAQNTAAPPDGWPEGQPASTVNDCARAMQGAIRRQWEDAAWFDWGDTITFVSATEFNVTGAGTLTDRYQLQRRVRVIGSTTGTIYGTITDVTGSTVVTVAWDSGQLVSESGLTAALGSPTENSAISGAALASDTPGAIPVGGMMIFAGTGPAGQWLLADGSALNAVTNPEYDPLFQVIGTTYGGTGNTNFFLPDATRRQLTGVGTGYALGDITGSFTAMVGAGTVVPSHIAFNIYIRY